MNVKLTTGKIGLEAVLGPLEIRVLDALWDDDRSYLTNQQILRSVIRSGHPISLTTITTTTKRMSHKKMLTESCPHGVLVYSPTITRNDLIDCVIERVLSTLIVSWPEHLETYIEGIVPAMRAKVIGDIDHA